MYLCEFMNIGAERYYVTANVRTGKLKMELVTNEAFERFIRDVISMGEDRSIPAGKKEVSA